MVFPTRGEESAAAILAIGPKTGRGVYSLADSELAADLCPQVGSSSMLESGH